MEGTGLRDEVPADLLRIDQHALTTGSTGEIILSKDTYDAIVVGAGHNGLCMAAYLQRAGLSTLHGAPRPDGGRGRHTPGV